MKPSHIHVFDGLRITTEHINHLQGSFHSAIQDFRQIFGLGKIYLGFEVVKENNKSITVRPGFAFDYQSNRIVCNEPKAFNVEFKDDQSKIFVCIQYKQIEKSLCEETPTMIWDSCSVLLKDKFPTEEDNLIPIAKLINVIDKEIDFEIESFTSIEQFEESTDEVTFDEESELESEKDETTEELEFSPASDNKDKLPAQENNEIVLPDAVSIDSQVPPDEKIHQTLRVRQGVVHLTPESETGREISEIILEPMKYKFSDQKNSSCMCLYIPIFEEKVQFDLPVLSLNCHTIIKSEIGMFKHQTEEEQPEDEEGTPQPISLIHHTTAQGEATLNKEEVTQFGLSTFQQQPAINREIIHWPTSELTELGIAHLPFSILKNSIGLESLNAIEDVLQNLKLIVFVERSKDNGFKFNGKLTWEGEINENIIKKIEENKTIFLWNVQIAWKALCGFTN